MGHLTDFEKGVFEKNATLKVAIPDKVDLGNPRYKDCRYLGICRINYYNSASPSLMPSCCPNRARGFIRRWEETGVELIFPKENMAPATLERHFGSGWFTIMDAYELSADMSQRLGIAGFTFEPGRYPVQEEGGKLHVVFR